jgi:MoxR-like ATPase
MSIAVLSTPRLRGAAKTLGFDSADKGELIAHLSEAMRRGQITADQIANATPILQSGAPVVADAAASAAARAEAVALDAVAATNRLREQITKVTDAVDAVSKAVIRLDRSAADQGVVETAIQAAVDKALKPVIRAAKANGTEAAVIAATRAPEVKTVQEVFGIALNDLKGKPLTVGVWNDPSAPAVDPSYIWQESILRAMVLSASTGTPVWLGGEKGTGKTQAAMQWAARTGRAFTRINFHKYSSAEEYLGATGLVNGQTQFVPGAFLTAYTHPGAVILLDEPTNADPGELAPLNGALERGTPRVNIGGQVWSRASGVMVVAADNTLTNGDASGRYAGTRVMNSALADRFGYIVPVTWLPADQERDALVSLTGCHPNLAAQVVRVMTACRAKAASGDIVDAPSIRSAMAWIEAMPSMGVKAAWDISVAARQPSESAVQLEAIFTAQVNTADFERDI